MKWAKRVGYIFITLLTIGSVYEYGSSQIDRMQMPAPPGKMIDVGGYKLHLQTAGIGNMTVVFDAGMGTPSLDWALVQPEIAKFARTCTYDRAGLGWSEESPHPRTSEHIAEELHTLLRNAGVPGPYILVSHSMGGIHMRLFASRYPDEVAGLVLVDASYEDMNERLPPDPVMDKSKQSSLLSSFFRIFGVQRLLLNLPSAKKLFKNLYKDYPSPFAESYLKMQTTPHHLQMVMKENESVDACLKELRSHDVSLGDKPLVVVTAGALTYMADDFGYPKEWIDQTYEIWKTLQLELVELSSCSKQLMAEKSDHLIPRRQPEIIIQAIHDVIQMYKRQSRAHGQKTLATLD